MKTKKDAARTAINIILTTTAIAGFALALLSRSALWFVGFMSAFASVLGLIDLNTDNFDRFIID